MITFNRKTRKDLSNPYNKIPHSELLRLANVKTFKEFDIEYLKNNRIIIKEKK